VINVLTATAAQPGIAADRFAHEIVRILKTLSARSRQLNGNPFGGSLITAPCSYIPIHVS
jgi:hypothetical protein